VIGTSRAGSVFVIEQGFVQPERAREGGKMAELTIEQARALAPLVSPEEAAARVADGAVLIDVRSAAGRSAGGVLTGAHIVAKDQVDERFGLDSVDRVPDVESAQTPIVIVCGSEFGSGPVAAELIARGFTDVVHVRGGFPAWKEAGLPTEPPAGEHR
jgi:rhodanese-related sulfurtransferase